VKVSDSKTVFRKVFVKSEGVGYLAGFHDSKAEAINKAYVPVVDRKKPLDGPGVPVIFDPYRFQKRHDF